MKQMVPFVPHLAHECLELHKCKTVNMWPSIKKNDLIEKIKLAVQVNGKTRDILEVSKDLKEKDINDIINSQSKAKKYLDWFPTYSVKNGVKITTEWYKDVFKNKKDPFKVTINQILEYMNENNWC